MPDLKNLRLIVRGKVKFFQVTFGPLEKNLASFELISGAYLPTVSSSLSYDEALSETTTRCCTRLWSIDFGVQVSFEVRLLMFRVPTYLNSTI